MKKFFITFAISCASLLSINANAQDKALVKGDNLISATIGFGSFTVSNIAVPPISVSYENIVFEFGNHWGIGVGGFGGFLTQKYDSVSNFGGAICAMGNLHFCPNEHWDVYTGFGLGAAMATTKSPYSSSKTTAAGFTWAYMIGGRYFFSDTFGVNLQLGGLGICNLGVSFKF